nr:unnamed protein product [Callosobruchus analis]
MYALGHRAGKKHKRPVQEFCTGSRYVGEWNELGFTGDGIYSSSKTFWSVAKSVSKSFSYPSVPLLSRENKVNASTPKEKADTLGKLFAAYSTVDFQGSTPTTIFKVDSRMVEIKFQQRDVKKILQNLNTNKASDPDQIPAIVLKHCAVELTPILCKLLSIYGFRKHRSTGDLLAYVTHMWNKAIQNHGESRIVAHDLSKDFGRVWHEGLLAKIAAYGPPPGLRQWLNSFLNDRSLFVVVEGSSSDVFPINVGVPQGCVLSPTVFLLHINELLEITSNPVYSFADDSTLVSCMEPGKPLPSQEIGRLQHHRASQISKRS